MTLASRKAAGKIRAKGLARKTTTRVMADGVAAAVDQLIHPNGTIVKEYAPQLRDSLTCAVGLPTTKVQLTLSDEYWDAIHRLADFHEVGASWMVRVLGHIAMEQAYNELSGR